MLKIKPFFSVIITTYNSSSTIEDSLNSVLLQRYKNYEIIIVDDGSKDKTHQILKKYLDKIYIYKKLPHFGGPAKSRNFGIHKANARWIAFLDSDDIWHPNKLKIFYNFIKKDYEMLDVICSNEFIINGANKRKLKHGPYTKYFYKNLLINGNKLSPSASIVNKDFILKNNIFFNENKKFISVEDYDFWLRLALKNAKFRFINKELSYYCINKNNLTNNKNLFFKNLLNLLRYHVYYIQKFDDNKLFLFIRLKYKVYLIRIKQFFFSNNFFNYFILLFK